MRKKVFVAGANGQLGREVQRQLADRYDLLLYDLPAFDITDFSAVWRAMELTKPEVVINAAAYTNVERAEEDVDTAYRVNAIGAQNLAIACQKTGSKLVHISTDYIFDGAGNKQYTEFDLPNALSVYGKSKLLGEQLIQQAGCRYFILRTAWLYGDGNNFVKTMLRLSREKDEINVVADQYGTPTYTKDLCWVIEKLLHTEFYGVYHASNKGECTWCDFAQEIFSLCNLKIKVKPVTTDQYPVKAIRPQYSVMENQLLKLRDIDVMRDWREALYDYLVNDLKVINGLSAVNG